MGGRQTGLYESDVRALKLANDRPLAPRFAGGSLFYLSAAPKGKRLRPILTCVEAPCWSPDGKWIVVGGQNTQGPGLFKIPADGGAASRLSAQPGINPVWSPSGNVIVFAGNTTGRTATLLRIRPDGSKFDLPPIVIGAGPVINQAHHRFTPDGKGLIFMKGLGPGQDFWHLDLATGR